MKESYTRKEIEEMLKEAEELLNEKFKLAKSKEEADITFDRLLGCEFTIGVFKACMDMYEKGWKI